MCVFDLFCIPHEHEFIGYIAHVCVLLLAPPPVGFTLGLYVLPLPLLLLVNKAMFVCVLKQIAAVTQATHAS